MPVCRWFSKEGEQLGETTCYHHFHFECLRTRLQFSSTDEDKKKHLEYCRENYRDQLYCEENARREREGIEYKRSLFDLKFRKGMLKYDRTLCWFCSVSPVQMLPVLQSRLQQHSSRRRSPFKVSRKKEEEAILRDMQLNTAPIVLLKRFKRAKPLPDYSDDESDEEHLFQVVKRVCRPRTHLQGILPVPASPITTEEGVECEAVATATEDTEEVESLVVPIPTEETTESNAVATSSSFPIPTTKRTRKRTKVSKVKKVIREGKPPVLLNGQMVFVCDCGTPHQTLQQKYSCCTRHTHLFFHDVFRK